TLCSNHFDAETCFKISGQKRILLKGSIPTNFGAPVIQCALCKVMKGQDNPTFWKFPVNESNRLQAWLAVFEDSSFTPNNNSRLCNEHFSSNCFRFTDAAKHLRLRDDAIPTISMLSFFHNFQFSSFIQLFTFIFVNKVYLFNFIYT
ncbi:THAP domain-containing protein 8, partial [Cyphomyrmex costatus]